MSTNTRRTQLQILEDKRAELTKAITANNAVIQTLESEQQDRFRKNFVEFASQEYLLNTIEVREIIRFAVNVTKIGLDIAPSSNEVYIIPFDTKINNQKVMLPQAIIPFNGMQQLAYQSGFMLTVDPVYKFSETECASSRELTRVQQSKLNTADPKWLDTHFIGYDVVLKDLKGELGEQVYFVDSSYVKAATKTNKDPRWSLSTWTHKAVRKAYKQFLVPRDRALEQFEKLEKLNDDQLIDVDVMSSKKLTADIENAVNQLGLKLIKKNGIATLSGTTFGKDKMIQDWGFVYNNKVWTIQYDDAIAPTQTNPVNELMDYLKQNGLSKEEIGKFVTEVLQLDRNNIEGIKTVLSDKDSLNLKVQQFLKPTTNTVPEIQYDSDLDIPNDIF